jgi:hypothetical protein
VHDPGDKKTPRFFVGIREDDTQGGKEANENDLANNREGRGSPDGKIGKSIKE